MDSAYLASGPSYRSDSPSVVVSVQKLENGYVVSLQANPPVPKYTPQKPVPSPFAGQDPDELIDRMIDGMGALIRSINDKGAGEDWKDGDDRRQVREAFRVMFPGMSSQIQRLTSDVQEGHFFEGPRVEHLVFESKAKLIEYLTKEL